jgi:glycosyltransferase involved in cell wall biosynthesis
MNDNLKVVIFVPNLKEKSGIYRYCLDFLKNLIVSRSDNRLGVTIISLRGNTVTPPLLAFKNNAISFIQCKSLFDAKRIILEQDSDIIHFLTPDLSSLFLLSILSGRTKKILTIHDLYFLHRKLIWRELVPWIKDRVRSFFLSYGKEKIDGFIAVSGSTASIIEKYLSVPPQKIFIIYHGISGAFTHKDNLKCENKYGDYLLSNHMDTSFLRVFIRIAKENPDIKLIFFGTKSAVDQKAIVDISDELGIKDRIIFLSNVPDDDLVCLYRNAKCFVRCVKDEGFGLPVVEAMACGCPVVVSDRGSLPEVVGIPDIILPFDDEDKWYEVINRILHNEDFRSSLIAQGRARAAEFDWDYSIKKVQQCYFSVR